MITVRYPKHPRGFIETMIRHWIAQRFLRLASRLFSMATWCSNTAKRILLPVREP